MKTEDRDNRGMFTYKSARIALLLIIAFLFGKTDVSAESWTVPSETLTYDVMYKWGLINKKAGSVTIITTPLSGQDRFQSVLTGATASWADRFYKVRDTLRGTIDSRTFMPFKYEKISYEGGDFSHDELQFSRTGNTTKAVVVRRRKHKKDKEMVVMNKELTADGVTLDMLSSFYYMRHLDYSAMKSGETVSMNVFSGRQKERLTIHFVGVEDITIDKKSYPSYHIKFTFTSESGKKTSDNMDAWLSTSRAKMPLLLEGKLPVGKIRCFLSSRPI